MVNSTPEKIWNILINFEEYELWNPFSVLILVHIGTEVFPLYQKVHY